MNEITAPNELQEPEPRKAFMTDKRWVLFVYIPIFLLFFSTVGILIDNDKGFGRITDLIGGLVLNIFTYVWIRMDSQERRYELHRFFSYAVVVFGTLALIYYLFRSRGFRGGVVSLGWLLLYVIPTFLFVMIVSAVIVLALVMAGAVSPNVFD
ncbi:MAG TPA: hypothetical protein PLL77_14185 [Pyrinomonadaceae bacterium]|nr:hypothetical protein [Pyrinomonadaceae bacterium]